MTLRDNKQSQSFDSKKSPKSPKKKRQLIRKAVGIAAVGSVAATTMTAVGAVATWQYLTHQQRHRRTNLSAFDTIIEAKPYQGVAHRDAQTFTLTTAAKTYHLHDPLAIIDDIAREQGAMSDYYDCHVSVLAHTSQKGHYGYLGHLDYQLTVTGRYDEDASSIVANYEG